MLWKKIVNNRVRKWQHPKNCLFTAFSSLATSIVKVPDNQEENVSPINPRDLTPALAMGQFTLISKNHMQLILWRLTPFFPSPVLQSWGRTWLWCIWCWFCLFKIIDLLSIFKTMNHQELLPILNLTKLWSVNLFNNSNLFQFYMPRDH